MENQFKVPLKQWRRWSNQARGVFNEVYDFMFNNQDLLLHPKTPRAPQERWRTTAWNAAWIAADAVDEVPPKQVILDIHPKTGVTVKETQVRRTLQ